MDPENSFLDPESGWQRLARKVQTAFTTRPDKFKPLLEELNPDPDYVSDVAMVKRFLERWTADREFRQSMDTPEQASMLARHKIDIDPDEIRYLWDHDFCVEKMRSTTWSAPLRVQRYRLWIVEKLLHRERLRTVEIAPRNEQHARWRQRQMNRVLGHLGKKPHQGIVHAPFTAELSDGCSVGCWFCGVSAERRKQDWPYTPENEVFWHGVLEQLHERLGEAARHGFCYWATDPLDNPDYEKFLRDYADRLGSWPQTTTAQAHKYVDRVRKLLIESRQRGCLINRFSILSLGIFNKVTEAFSADELLYTELITQNMEATSMQSNSGRARGSNRLKVKAEQTEAVGDGWEKAPGTIACVSGFLLNMPLKRVRLITPVPCNDRWPNGYWIMEERHFQTPEELGEIMDGMIERHMPISVRLGMRVGFRKDIRFGEVENGFELKSWGLVTTFTGNQTQTAIARKVAQGNLTAQEVALAVETEMGAPLEQTLFFLNHLFDRGLLDEEPAESRQEPTSVPQPELVSN